MRGAGLVVRQRCSPCRSSSEFRTSPTTTTLVLRTRDRLRDTLRPAGPASKAPARGGLRRRSRPTRAPRVGSTCIRLCAARAAGGEHRRVFSEALRAARGAAGFLGCPRGWRSAPDRAETLPHAHPARLVRPAGTSCGLLRASVPRRPTGGAGGSPLRGSGVRRRQGRVPRGWITSAPNNDCDSRCAAMGARRLCPCHKSAKEAHPRGPSPRLLRCPRRHRHPSPSRHSAIWHSREAASRAAATGHSSRHTGREWRLPPSS